MARQTFPQPRLTNQQWMGSPVAHWHLVPGGGVLDPAATWATPPDHPELRGVPNRAACFAGTLIGRVASVDPATPSPAFVPWDAAHTEVYLVPFDVLDIASDNGVELLTPTKMFHIYWNWLPNWAGRPTAEQDKIRELYNCIKGGDITDGVEIGATVL